MKTTPLIYSTDTDRPVGSIYDAEPVEEADLWFLPGPDEENEDVPPGIAPLPRANQRLLVDLADWTAAEAAFAKPLAQLAMRLGALDERLRRAPKGWCHRLALIEASALSWLGTERISIERLSLWQALRLGGVQNDNQALARAGWAARRLSCGSILRITSADDISDFLGRWDVATGRQSPELGCVYGDEMLSDQLTNWCEAMQRARGLHPICRAAFGLHLWAVVGLSDRTLGADIEAAVLAARLAVTDLPGEARFLPLVGGGVLGLAKGGSPEQRLQKFIKNAESATLAALRHLEALERWQARAEDALAHKSGQTPKQLITILASWPMVSAPMAEAEIGASRAAVQRNLNELTQMGLIREVTGQGRYRSWTAAIQ